MEAIRKYVERFFASGKYNKNYDMSLGEWAALSNSGTKTSDIAENSFYFGYAKGYRAAMAEMKKGGAA